ncbi:DUF998 domain-containing protein [Enterococcus sp. 669A]|uniref:DUF998 domain-containing protein n=1 Tax=Candidatus Enterococcus moelleringii TaxID=2815325 RepID=A0ABS3LC69_9ENTE|nr:DUF998 domain-containing protein [Enterococcus sp. 669A]MBO1307224.1 DUF998 domain-containing protein [Enterococcus sp. 669A]
MKVLSKGWLFLLIAVIGEMLVPLILAPFYPGYDSKTMAISSLGNPNSPVRLPFNLWMLTAGVLLLLATPSIYRLYRGVSKPLSIATVMFIGIFAVGACIFTCFFSVNETKDVITTASVVHGFGSVIGFMLLLFVPLFLAILSFKSADRTTGVIAVVSFILSLVFFVLFIMAEKPQFQETMIASEGLWQRLNLLFMYLPLAFIAVKNLLS